MPIMPTIPTEIVIHLGAPNEDAPNVTETFANYIKNVASSEIYPTWPTEALKANIMAQISVALNRVYTGYYRNSGYSFDITDSPAYDQTYVYQRDIFANIATIVDELYDSYIRRSDSVEPLYAEFCDGEEIQCNGLSQWGSVSLAESGMDYTAILRNYYGSNIVIEQNVPVKDRQISTPDVTLREGDTGADVELMQLRLNRISANYPGIPKINPIDGYFGKSTTDAVKKFQEVFSLQQDGLVGRATWNQIEFVYNAVKRLYELNSEGLKYTELATRYVDKLSEGDTGDGVLTVQYYLAYIALFVSTVRDIEIDGSFGPKTTEAVESFQRTYGIPINGVVDRLTWDRMEAVYNTYVSEINYAESIGVPLPYPGRILGEGVEGNDVRVLQEYLNYIAKTYPDIPTGVADGIYGPVTAAQVDAFKKRFGLEFERTRVNAPIWNAIASVYDDLSAGNSVVEGQYPGNEIRR